MLLLQEFVAYVWMVPVVMQIVLPLALLILWLGFKILENLFGRERRAAQSADSLSTASFEKTA